MTAFLRKALQLVVAGDAPATSNPRQRFIDWAQDLSGIEVKNPLMLSPDLAPGETFTFFDGTRALTLDGTTALALQLVAGTADLYRFRHTGGTNPTFRTDRAVDFSGDTIAVTVNSNSTATFTSDGTFTGAQEGDTVWIPDVAEVGTQPFNVGNQGFWRILAIGAGAASLVCERLGEFEAQAETGIAVTAANQFQVFSAAGVQVGDVLEILGGFASVNRRSYSVVAVTSKYLEVQSSVAAVAEAGVTPGSANFLVRTASKRLVHVEADQSCVVRVNGDTGDLQRIDPWTPGDPKAAGHYSRAGATWKLVVVNKSPRTAKVLVISVE
jgi:hypothetical protein